MVKSKMIESGQITLEDFTWLFHAFRRFSEHRSELVQLAAASPRWIYRGAPSGHGKLEGIGSISSELLIGFSENNRQIMGVFNSFKIVLLHCTAQNACPRGSAIPSWLVTASAVIPIELEPRPPELIWFVPPEPEPNAQRSEVISLSDFRLFRERLL